MIKAFSDGNSSPDLLKTMPDQMLEQLSAAVVRDWEVQKKRSTKPIVHVTIEIPAEHDVLELEAHEGDSMIDLVTENELLKQYVVCACGGNASCSTCHVFIDKPHFYAVLEPPEEHEEDMLDLAMGSAPGRSRLGCQIRLTADCEGMRMIVPDGVSNLM